MELVRSTSRGGFSVRSIFTFALAVISAALLWAIFSSTPSHAATEANWNGESILFDGKVYQKAPADISKSHGLADGTIIYVYYSPNNVEASAKEAFFIYFAPGTDPPTATSAQFVKYAYNSTDNTFSGAKDSQTVTMTPQGEEDAYSSCTVTGGLGWIICPITVTLAGAMDFLFGIIADFLTVQPLTIASGEDNGLYVAWNIMRNIANVAFVIAFLLIIYSQLTNTGLSNYSLKKIIPRLVVAAVLVNVSFIISALAVDISNILGFSVQDLLNTIREDVFHVSDDTLGSGMNNGWSVVAAAIIGGGGAIAGTLYAVSSGAIWLLVPMLVLLALTVLLVLVVLAARQAIIIILVVIAPLAFVANLLPNTEKWFDKWRDLFMTMLIFFPAFSLVFGGSQLAGQIIIMNSGDNLIMALFGMAVQIAPLVITPLLLKLSGGLLGKIAQIANNPNKGLLDRNKKWAHDRAELRRQKSVANGFGGNPMRWGAGMVRGNDYRRRNLQGKLDVAKQRAENAYHDGSKKYANIHEDMHDAQLDKERIETVHKAHLTHEGSKLGSKLNVRTLELENAKVDLERVSAESSHMISGYRANVYDTAGNEHLANLQKSMANNVIETAAWKQGEQNNQYLQQRAISDAFSNSSNPSNSRLLDIAQGYGDVNQLVVGRERAQANAVATLTKLNKDARENTITLMETEAVAAKKSVKQFALEDVYAKAASDNATIRGSVTRARLEAALEIAAADGNVSTFDDARANMHVDQTIVDAVVARNIGTFKQKGGFHIQADPKLSLQRYVEAFNANDMQYGSTLEEVQKTFFEKQSLERLGTLSNTTAENLGGMKYGAFTKLAVDMITPNEKTGKTLLDYIPHDAETGRIADPGQAAMVEQIFETLRDGLDDPSTRASMTDRLKYARQMEETLRTTFFKATDPLVLSESERIQTGSERRPASMGDNPILIDTDIDPNAETPTDNGDN